MLFTYPIRIYYEDTDAGGVVYHANYLKFFERARTELLRSLGYEQTELKTKDNIVFAVYSLQINYIKPALFNDLLQVTTNISRIKKASLIFQQTINRDNTLLCTATIEVACVNIQNFRPIAIPYHLVEQLTNES